MFYDFAANLRRGRKFGAKEPAQDGHLQKNAPVFVREAALALPFRTAHPQIDAPRRLVDAVCARNAALAAARSFVGKGKAPVALQRQNRPFKVGQHVPSAQGEALTEILPRIGQGDLFEGGHFVDIAARKNKAARKGQHKEKLSHGKSICNFLPFMIR